MFFVRLLQVFFGLHKNLLSLISSTWKTSPTVFRILKPRLQTTPKLPPCMSFKRAIKLCKVCNCSKRKKRSGHGNVRKQQFACDYAACLPKELWPFDRRLNPDLRDSISWQLTFLLCIRNEWLFKENWSVKSLKIDNSCNFSCNLV